MKVQYGISAINWVNEDIKEYGNHYTAEQVLTDMASLGYEGTEFSRKFPRDVEALGQLLASKNMVLTSQWRSVHFSNPDRHEEEMAGFRDHADFLKAMGCRYVVVCESSNKIEDLGENKVRIEQLTDAQWGYMVEGLHKAGQYCKDNGMKLVYHFHGETVVETGEEVARLMEMTEPELVHLLFDTGHAYYGGSDPLTILRDHYDRIAYIHLKDVRAAKLEQHLKDGYRFREGVRRGVFTVPGDGCIDFKPIFDELERRGYEGWIIIEAEQNPDIANPLQYAEKARDYIKSITE